ncbi:MAG: NAD(P)-dependent dehydrogenase, short-chain alcohol dehydrogenase family [Chloroflexi bacterium]|nr:MAG: NAD(P)-dependent dehydrogenase, short-chain alcohol dehydrogenase family [Chloroflexota bacterium]
MIKQDFVTGMRLKKKKIIVTGGTSGIGLAIVSRFIQEGATVLVADIREDLNGIIGNLASSSGNRAHFRKTDVSDIAEVKEMVGYAIEVMGGVDSVVNNAASFTFGEVDTLDYQRWMKAISVNVIGTANVCKSTLEYLKKSDHPTITNIASISSFIAQAKSLPYNSTKGAIAQLTRCLAMDWGVYGIRVNGICPGDIHTDGWYERGISRQKKIDPSDPEGFIQEASSMSLMGRVGKPEEVANLALFLASEEASYITGAMVVIDGGATIAMN